MARLPQLHLPGGVQLSARQRTAAKVAGYGLLCLVTFLVTLKYSLPYSRIKGMLVDGLSKKYDVTVGSVTHGFWPGQIEINRLILRTRPTQPDQKPFEIIINRAEIDLGLDYAALGLLLHKQLRADFDVDMGKGEIAGNVALAKAGSLRELTVETDGLPLGSLPGVSEAVGLPMAGPLDAEIDIRLPGGKWKNAEGSISIACNNCTVGDGVTKMKPPAPPGRRHLSAAAQAWRAEGVTVPRLNLGKAHIEVAISKGVGTIKTFAAESKDGWLKLDGNIGFHDPLSRSTMPGCLHFKLSDELKKRDPKFGNIEYTLPERSRQGDGSFAIPTKGQLAAIRLDVRHKCTGGSTIDQGDDQEGLGGLAHSRSPGMPSLPVPSGKVTAPEVPGVAGAGANGNPERLPGPGVSSGPPLKGVMGQGKNAHDGGPPAVPPDDENGAPAEREPLRPEPDQTSAADDADDDRTGDEPPVRIKEPAANQRRPNADDDAPADDRPADDGDSQPLD